ncbi:MAG: hypothetical protein L0H93_07535 [Nocardioides sp.]|nr:hypothetical protein [Nocardioides sp.]
MKDPQPAAPVQVEHRLSPDGLTLTSIYRGPEGSATSSVSWRTAEQAATNYAAAVQGFENRVPQLQARLAEDNHDSRSWIKNTRFGSVYVNTGPPTWWRPNFQIRRVAGATHIKCGWLRIATIITIGRQT